MRDSADRCSSTLTLRSVPSYAGRCSKLMKQQRALRPCALARFVDIYGWSSRVMPSCRDVLVSTPQFKDCCWRLLECAPRIVAVAEGMSIRVSTESRPPSWASPCIDLAWDFKE